MHEIIWKLIRLKRRSFPSFKIDNIPLLKGMPQKINSFLKQFPIEIHGDIVMYLDKLDTLGLGFDRIYEPEITALLKKNMKQGYTALDIGAHIGYYTLLLAKIAGVNAKVFAFEPAPSNYSILKKNIQINKLNNVQALNMAVSDFSGESFLFESETNTGDHRTYKSSDNRKSIKIKCIKLDEMTALFEKPVNIIKMDIQGAEFRALMGMQNLIKTNKQILFITEFCPYGINNAGAHPKEYINELFNLDLKIFEFSNGKHSEIRRYSELSSIYKSCDPSAYTNLVCAKNIVPIFD